MSTPTLTPDAIRNKYSSEIATGESFMTHGVSKRSALDYLETPEGKIYLNHVRNASPNAKLETVFDRAVEQITSGLELPHMEVASDPLVKLTRLNGEISPYSAYLTKESEINEALASGRSLHDYFGLPAKSEAARYRLDEIRPLAPTEVFISHVAPTTELGGLITRSGGGEQYLVPNRKLFTSPVHLRDIDNTLNVAAELESGSLSSNLIRGASALGTAAVAYDATTTASRAADLREHGNRVGAESEIMHLISARWVAPSWVRKCWVRQASSPGRSTCWRQAWVVRLAACTHARP